MPVSLHELVGFTLYSFWILTLSRLCSLGMLIFKFPFSFFKGFLFFIRSVYVCVCTHARTLMHMNSGARRGHWMPRIRVTGGWDRN